MKLEDLVRGNEIAKDIELYEHDIAWLESNTPTDIGFFRVDRCGLRVKDKLLICNLQNEVIRHYKDLLVELEKEFDEL